MLTCMAELLLETLSVQMDHFRRCWFLCQRIGLADEQSQKWASHLASALTLPSITGAIAYPA